MMRIMSLRTFGREFIVNVYPFITSYRASLQHRSVFACLGVNVDHCEAHENNDSNDYFIITQMVASESMETDFQFCMDNVVYLLI